MKIEHVHAHNINIADKIESIVYNQSLPIDEVNFELLKRNLPKLSRDRQESIYKAIVQIEQTKPPEIKRELSEKLKGQLIKYGFGFLSGISTSILPGLISKFFSR